MPTTPATQYVVMRSGGIVGGPVPTLAAAMRYCNVRAYGDARDVSVIGISDAKLTEIEAAQRDLYTIHEVTISPAITVEGK